MDAKRPELRSSPIRAIPSQQPQISNESWIELLKFKDQETYRHSNRVSELTLEWVQHQKSRGMWLHVNTEELAKAAEFHDLGKLGVLDQVLKKSGPLTDSEREHLNQHSEIGYELVRDVSGFSNIAFAIRHHHERWDGAGYPLGLKKDQIPFYSLVIALVDAYDAMTSDRPYRKAGTREHAIREIENNAGSQFSPALAEAFVQFLHARNL